MRTLVTILYWGLCLPLLATLFASLGYDFASSMLVGAMFLPGLLMIKYMLPQIRFKMSWQSLSQIIYLSLSVFVLTYLLLFIINYYLKIGIYPPMLNNPVFLLLIIAPLALIEHFIDEKLKQYQAKQPQTVDFISERRHVTLLTSNILYIESLDSEVAVHTIDGEILRTRTPISRWEATLNELHFIRIHRSYIVHIDSINNISRTEVELKDITLPVSRKYAERVILLKKEDAEMTTQSPTA